MYYKSKFTLSDSEEEFEGYTDGSLWNGWANVFFTREQVVEFLPAQYDPMFLEPRVAGNHRDFPILVLNNGRDTETYGATYFPVWGEENIDRESIRQLEVFGFDGWEFMEVK
jgi:hypothetical protein